MKNGIVRFAKLIKFDENTSNEFLKSITNTIRDNVSFYGPRRGITSYNLLNNQYKDRILKEHLNYSLNSFPQYTFIKDSQGRELEVSGYDLIIYDADVLTGHVDCALVLISIDYLIVDNIAEEIIYGDESAATKMIQGLPITQLGSVKLENDSWIYSFLECKLEVKRL